MATTKSRARTTPHENESKEYFIELVTVQPQLAPKPVGALPSPPNAVPSNPIVLPKPDTRITRRPEQLPQLNETYEATKRKLFDLVHDLEGVSEDCDDDFDTLYDPIQKQEIAKNIRYLIASLDDESVFSIDFECKFFKMKANSPPRDEDDKAEICRTIYNAVVDPLNRFPDFADYVDRLKVLYPRTKHPKRLSVIASVEMILAGIFFSASLIAGFLTGGIGFIGIVPSSLLMAHAFRQWDDAQFALEREKFEKMNAIISSFNGENEYANIKRKLFYTVGKLKMLPDEGKPAMDEKNEQARPNLLQKYIVRLIECLDKTDLPEAEKILILSEVNAIASDPKDGIKSDSFAKFVFSTQAKFPTDSKAMCQAKLKISVALACLGAIASIFAAGFTLGTSVIAGCIVFPSLTWKYGQYKEKELNLACVKEQLGNMSKDIANHLPRHRRG